MVEQQFNPFDDEYITSDSILYGTIVGLINGLATGHSKRWTDNGADLLAIVGAQHHTLMDVDPQKFVEKMLMEATLLIPKETRMADKILQRTLELVKRFLEVSPAPKICLWSYHNTRHYLRHFCYKCLNSTETDCICKKRAKLTLVQS